jgi:dihydrofolate reductase
MRKIILFNNVTVDGFMAGPNGELDWTIHDDEMTQQAKEGQDSADTFLFGRVTYDMMAAFWPTPAGESVNPVFAHIMNTTSKIVFSRTLEKADWNNTRVVKELNIEEILKIKKEPGKNIMIFGSGTIVQQLTNLELIDEYQLMVNPVILGKGKPLFNDVKKMDLVLLNTRTFKNGIVLLTYKPG